MLNNAIIMGRLVRDPEIRYMHSQKAVTNFTLAVDRPGKSENGESVVDFIDCTAWGWAAGFVQNWFSKGQMMAVIGEIRVDSYTDKNGNKRRKTYINVNSIHFCESKKARDAVSAAATADDFGELDMGEVPFA